MIRIVDCGVGNLHSVAKAFNRYGFEAAVTCDATELADASGIVLPGDGSFGTVMNNLRESGLLDVVLEAVGRKIPFLGICVGYQLMFEWSEESPGVPGLGLVSGAVRRFPPTPGLKVPHMGWNSLTRVAKTPLLEEINEGDMVYFVHSFYPSLDDPSEGAAWTDYGRLFPAVYARGNLMATQFHPEKSGAVGLGIIRAFGRITQC